MFTDMSYETMEEAGPSRYNYQPLNEDNCEIRLVTLLPSTDPFSEVICNLTIARLVEGEIPPYETLSYVWGSTESPCKLRISSQSNECIEITRNLAQVLPYLRYKSEPRVLWIDAIAINQQDIAERSSQVRRMADIYTMAERVVVWLGEDDVDSKTVMEICTDLNEKVEIPPGSFLKISPRTNDPQDAHWSDLRTPLPYDQATCQAIANFLRRPWFHRLWIWQEIGLANPKAVVLCGSDTMPWRSLVVLLTCIAFKHLPIESARSARDLGMLSQNAYNLAHNRRNRVLANLLHGMQSAHCADPRDRVYGILGLSRRTNTPVVVDLDYSKSVAEVYRDFAVSVATHTGNLALLALCRWDEDLNDWPSWVPRLNKPMATESGLLANSIGNAECCVEFPNDGTMRATGMRIDHVATFNTGTTPNESIITKVSRWMKMLDMASLYIDGRPMLEAYCRVLCTGYMSDISEPANPVWPDIESSMEILREMARLGNKAHPDNSEYYEQAVRSTFWRRAYHSCKGRNFFTTSRGHIGIGPLGLRQGDQICSLLGLKLDLVIRPLQNGRFKIIGQCYVAGMANGEALLGPLPAHYRQIIVQYPASISNYWTFLNTETGKVEIEDPRLGPELPEGWRRVKHDLDHVETKFARESDSEKSTKFDPRLSKSELIRRGVPLEDIEFV